MYKRLLCALLCASVLISYMCLPAGAENAAPEEFSAARTELIQLPEAPQPPEAEPEETQPQETEPEETQPQETEPEETQPQETVPEDTGPAAPYHCVPRFYQTDYPQVRYGSGTIATSGCSITCMTMVACYLTGHSYTPDQLARWFGGKAQNNMDRMEYAAGQLQLPFWKAPTVHDTFRALEEGKVAIALMSGDSLFSDTQHFIVLCGVTQDGKILVNDPLKSNYDHWRLREGLISGFEYDEILPGYSGAWIFDKSEIPAEPFVYSEPELDKSNPRYPDIRLTEGDLELLARLIWTEARGECFEGQQAVAEVVFNRLASPHFPDSMHDIIYGEGQFKATDQLEEAEPNQTQYEAIERAFYGPYILPEDVMFFAREALNDHPWGSIGGHVFCHYY